MSTNIKTLSNTTIFTQTLHPKKLNHQFSGIKSKIPIVTKINLFNGEKLVGKTLNHLLRFLFSLKKAHVARFFKLLKRNILAYSR